MEIEPVQDGCIGGSRTASTYKDSSREYEHESRTCIVQVGGNGTVCTGTGERSERYRHYDDEKEEWGEWYTNSNSHADFCPLDLLGEVTMGAPSLLP